MQAVAESEQTISAIDSSTLDLHRDELPHEVRSYIDTLVGQIQEGFHALGVGSAVEFTQGIEQRSIQLSDAHPIVEKLQQVAELIRVGGVVRWEQTERLHSFKVPSEINGIEVLPSGHLVTSFDYPDEDIRSRQYRHLCVLDPLTGALLHKSSEPEFLSGILGVSPDHGVVTAVGTFFYGVWQPYESKLRPIDVQTEGSKACYDTRRGELYLFSEHEQMVEVRNLETGEHRSYNLPEWDLTWLHGVLSDGTLVMEIGYEGREMRLLHPKFLANPDETHWTKLLEAKHTRTQVWILPDDSIVYKAGDSVLRRVVPGSWVESPKRPKKLVDVTGNIEIRSSNPLVPGLPFQLIVLDWDGGGDEKARLRILDLAKGTVLWQHHTRYEYPPYLAVSTDNTIYVSAGKTIEVFGLPKNHDYAGSRRE